ncbi:hypothetical protein [Silvimonas sp.]|uniref:hypothetical protein n=1 Tax=Silvimonas sp. TaxID=2650811 RepID=UPI00284A2F79|nr:hypothetical protein [Silvimonas sp.]MDR3428190.1 hypothetical protein [Silvimonas sp.]
MERFTWLIVLVGVLLAQAGWTSSMATTACEKSSASSPATDFPPRQQNHQRTTVAPPGTTSNVSNQYNYVYCPAFAAPAAASQPADTTSDDWSAGGDFTGPGDARKTPTDKAHEKTNPTKIDVRLSKDIGLTVETQDSAIAWAALAAAVIIVLFATWGVAHASKHPESPITVMGYALLIGGVLFLGGLVGYWWKDDVSTTLTTEQLTRLANSSDLQRAIADFSQANDERTRLQTRVDALEKDLALAQASAKVGSSQNAKVGDWGISDWPLALLLMLAAAMVSGLWAQRAFVAQINALQVKLAESRTAMTNAIDLLNQENPELSEHALNPDQQPPEHLLTALRAAVRMLKRAIGREYIAGKL